MFNIFNFRFEVYKNYKYPHQWTADIYACSDVIHTYKNCETEHDAKSLANGFINGLEYMTSIRR